MVRMDVEMEKDVFLKLKSCVEGGYPQEVCGALIGTKGKRGMNKVQIKGIEECENQVKGGEKQQCFCMNPLQIYRLEQKLERTGRELVGFFHSHPDCAAVLSEADESYMIPGMCYLIASVVQGQLGEIAGYRKPGAEGGCRSEPVPILLAQQGVGLFKERLLKRRL